MFVKINGEPDYLWRAVDQKGEALENCVSKKRDKKAALRLMKKALKRDAVPLKWPGMVLDPIHQPCANWASKIVARWGGG